MLFQFLLIFRKAAAGELAQDSGLYELYANVEEIDVDKEGVKGAKNFFEAKVSHIADTLVSYYRVHLLHMCIKTMILFTPYSNLFNVCKKE